MYSKILILFALMAVGFALRKKNVLSTQGVRNLVNVNIFLLLPALTFVTTSQYLRQASERTEGGLVPLLVGLPLTAWGVCAAGALLGRLAVPLTGLSGKSRATFVWMMAFANSAFLPVPLSYALQGEVGPLFVFLYNIGFTLMQWSLGMWLLSGHPQWRYLAHPQMICLIAGSSLGLSGWTLPAPVMEVFRMLGNSAIPLAMVWVGAVLGDEWTAMREFVRPLALLSVLKLAVLPAMVYAVLRTGWLPEPMGSQALLQASMPVMAQAGLFAGRFGGDSRMGSAAAFVTTLLCLATVPVWLGLLK